ncbi:MAG: hypothetical protein L0H64_13550 [Pseudonocardia sp.]|nr:hypothetical protein [Pseudonocardia sp.]
MHVIDTVDPLGSAATGTADARLVWIGPDDRGVEPEIVALDLPDESLAIHVVPTPLRRNR